MFIDFSDVFKNYLNNTLQDYKKFYKKIQVNGPKIHLRPSKNFFEKLTIINVIGLPKNFIDIISLPKIHKSTLCLPKMSLKIHFWLSKNSLKIYSHLRSSKKILRDPRLWAYWSSRKF